MIFFFGFQLFFLTFKKKTKNREPKAGPGPHFGCRLFHNLHLLYLLAAQVARNFST